MTNGFFALGFSPSTIAVPEVYDACCFSGEAAFVVEGLGGFFFLASF